MPRKRETQERPREVAGPPTIAFPEVLEHEQARQRVAETETPPDRKSVV